MEQTGVASFIYYVPRCARAGDSLEIAYRSMDDDNHFAIIIYFLKGYKARVTFTRVGSGLIKECVIEMDKYLVFTKRNGGDCTVSGDSIVTHITRKGERQG